MRTQAQTTARRFATILIAVAVAAALASCERGAEVRDRYVAEKLLWEAGKLNRARILNPDLNTPQMRERIAAQYREVIRTFPAPEGDPSALSDEEAEIARITGRSRLALAALLEHEEDLDAAVRLYASVRDSYAFSRELSVDASLALAAVEVKAGRWPEAVLAYDRMLERWPPAVGPDAVPDGRILRAPMNVAIVYRVEGDLESSAARFDDAREYYGRWAAEWPGTPTGELAMSLTAESLMHEERWVEAIAAYGEYDAAYGRRENRAALWLGMADVCETKLGRRDLARGFYERVEDVYGDELSGASAAVALAREDLDRGRHPAARERLEEVITRFPDEKEVTATAMQYLAASFEADGEWDRAVAEYYKLARDFPTTMYGMSALLHVADRYDTIGEAEAAASAYERAAAHYDRVILEFRGTPAEVAARRYLADTWIKQEMWEEAVNLLLESAARRPESTTSPVMMIEAADIYAARLGDAARAGDVLEQVMREYPDETWADEAAKKLVALGQARSDG